MVQHLQGLLIVKHLGGEKRPSPGFPQCLCPGVNSSLCEECCKVPSLYPVKKVRNVPKRGAALSSNRSKLVLRFLLAEFREDN